MPMIDTLSPVLPKGFVGIRSGPVSLNSTGAAPATAPARAAAPASPARPRNARRSGLPLCVLMIPPQLSPVGRSSPRGSRTARPTLQLGPFPRRERRAIPDVFRVRDKAEHGMGADLQAGHAPEQPSAGDPGPT